MVALLFACALHVTQVGLLEQEGGAVRLVREASDDLALLLGPEGDPLRFLEGCQVEIDGTRIGRRLVVSDWRVTVAADGSAPFVGRLRLQGNNWVLDDRTTGRPLVLDAASMGSLVNHVGQPVLIVGYVVGAQTVRVVDWRVLAGEGAVRADRPTGE
ncbi:MAG: hypothetical protein QGG40_15485 [Myxococcota bacterium]|jgi:hypothetical protein|nr:hypothetical protein [Myxococcota bacterium]